MCTKRALTAIAVAVGVAFAAGAPLGAQEPAGRMLQQQQVMQHQEQIARMHEVLQRMERIRERAQHLEQQLVQEMTRMRTQEGPDQARMIQNRERLRVMAFAMSEGARHTHQAMEQLRNMIGEQGAAWDAETESEFQRLRWQWEEMAGRMEEGLTIMERLRNRIG